MPPAVAVTAFVFVVPVDIPLLALTDRQNDGQRNEYTRCAWAGGTFFPVVLLCQFLVLAGNRIWFYILMYLEYNTVVVLC